MLLLVVCLILAVTACSERGGGRAGADRSAVVGSWSVTGFEQRSDGVATCLAADSWVEFRADGSWLGHTRDHATYRGTYRLAGADRLTLTFPAQTEQYRISVAGDTMTLRSGDALTATLRRMGTAGPMGSGEVP
jgi:hypothetical protein